MSRGLGDVYKRQVIDGFEEYKGKPTPRCLNDIKTDSLFNGVWTWSRGGGWSGPFLKNELWCNLNAYVMSKWAQNPSRPEAEIFDEYAEKIGITPETRPYFRRLSLLSADAIIRGRGSLIHKFAATWTRDEIIGGVPWQRSMFDDIYQKNLVEEALYEKKLATYCMPSWSRVGSSIYEDIFMKRNNIRQTRV